MNVRYHGLVYRADVPYWGAGPRNQGTNDGEAPAEEAEVDTEAGVDDTSEPKMILQSMKWGAESCPAELYSKFANVMKV